MDKFVLITALEYKRAMNNFGGNFSFPKADSIVDTYPYRTFNAFINKCKSSKFNESQILEIIKIIVRHMHKNRLIKKGIGVLSSPDIVDICIEELKNQLSRQDNIIKSINNSNEYFQKIQGNKINFLLNKTKKGGFSNIIMLRNKNLINDQFICLSKTCIEAYKKLDESDRQMLLSPKEYLILKMKIINIVGIDDIKKILGTDFNG